MDLNYTNEFLKKLEMVIKKEDHSVLENIKKALEEIEKETAEKKELVNIKTHKNNNIFQIEIGEKKQKYSLFWTEEKEQKTIISLIKRI